MRSTAEPGDWTPANNGAGERPYFLIRRDESLPVRDRYRYNSRGDLIRYTSNATAQAAADKLNATERTEP